MDGRADSWTAIHGQIIARKAFLGKFFYFFNLVVSLNTAVGFVVLGSFLAPTAPQYSLLLLTDPPPIQS